MMWHFRDTANALAAYLVEALNLEPVPIPDEFAFATGRWKDGTVRLHANAWTGPTIAFFRLVSLEGEGLEIANLLAVPGPAGADTIFGADLVSAKPGTALIVADLSPVARAAPPAAINPALPGWAAAIFSDTPLLLRISPEQRQSAMQSLHVLAEQFVTRSRHPLAAADPSRAVTAYMRAHRTDDRTRTMLSHIFGAAWSDRFIDTLMYPMPSPLSDRIDDDAA